MVYVKEVDVEYLIANATELFERHWQEVAKNKAVMLLEPRFEVFRSVAEQGALLCLGVFDDETDELVGYSVSMFMNHVHYNSLLVCQNDVVFVDKEHRNGTIGGEIITATEQIAAAKGAKLVLWHAKQDTAFERLLKSIDGYGVQDVIYSRRI